MEDTLLQCNYFVMGVRGVFGIFAVVAVVTVAAVYLQMGGTEDVSFQAWKAEHGFKWEQTEDMYRRIIFQMNVKAINEHNSDRSQTYKQGVNQFTAMTKQQFAAKYLNNLLYKNPSIKSDVQVVAPIANDIDWSTRISIPVKNQPTCGAYALTATIIIQADYQAATYRPIPDLSIQQIIDCSGRYGCSGCSGCYSQAALNYAKDYPLCTEQQYPYVSQAQTCKNKTGVNYRISNIIDYTNCVYLTTYIGTRPILVGVDATNWAPYKQGLFSNCRTDINHECLLVGVLAGAWKVQNTWGTSWGQSGYIRLSAGNTCGICQKGVAVLF